MQSKFLGMLTIFYLTIFSCCAIAGSNAEMSVMLKWGSFPGNKDVHEFFLHKGEVLYLIRREGENEKMPDWELAKINGAIEERILSKIDDAVRLSKNHESDPGKNCHSNNALQWGVKYNSATSQIIYGSKCDIEAVYEIVAEILSFTFPQKE